MLGKKYYSGNSFTIEFWFYPQISSSDEIPLVGDSKEDVGVFYQKGNIVFTGSTSSGTHTPPFAPPLPLGHEIPRSQRYSYSPCRTGVTAPR